MRSLLLLIGQIGQGGGMQGIAQPQVGIGLPVGQLQLHRQLCRLLPPLALAVTRTMCIFLAQQGLFPPGAQFSLNDMVCVSE